MLRSSGSGSSPERLAGGAFCCVEYVEQYGIGWLRGRSGRARVGPVPRGDRPRPERSASAVMSPAGGFLPISRRKSQWIRPHETSARVPGGDPVACPAPRPGLLGIALGVQAGETEDLRSFERSRWIMDALHTVPRELDHLIVTVPDLDAGVAAVEEATGLRAVSGGSHPGRGTANCLLGLSPTGWADDARNYLELLGPDPQQDPPADGRLALDAHLATAPTLQTWAIHPPAFLAKVAAANTASIDFGEVRDMSRETPDGDLLEWRLTTRPPLPAAGTQPIRIDWGESHHPAEASLPRLEPLDFAIETPEVDATRSALEVLGAGDTRVVEGPEPRLRARMRGPGGVL